MIRLVLGIGLALIWGGCEKMELHSEPLSEKLLRSQVEPPRDSSDWPESNLINDSVPIRVFNRSHQLEKFPCSECHEPGKPLQTEENKRAHWNIELLHGKADAIKECQTCHGNKMEENSLTSLAGNQIPFDQGYNLCGQCHYKARQDWEGGAHGKRLSGWLDSRVIRNCADCHNPHNPSFEPRWPAIAPQTFEAKKE